jgi:hypothetical protein
MSPIIAKDSGGNMFDPAPEGLHRCVCADVIDLGMQPSFDKTSEVHKIKFVWQTEDQNPKTKERYQIRSTYLTVSLNEKSNLSKLLEGWRGKIFTPEERRDGFDVETLKGVNCQIQVIHAESASGRKFGKVQAIIPPPKGVPPLMIEGYVRYGGEDASADSTAFPN